MDQTSKKHQLEQLFTKLKERAEADPEFQQRLRSHPNEALKEVDATDDEARQLLEVLKAEIMKERSENRELSNDDLDAVTGGNFLGDIFGWLGKLFENRGGRGSSCTHR